MTNKAITSRKEEFNLDQLTELLKAIHLSVETEEPLTLPAILEQYNTWLEIEHKVAELRALHHDHLVSELEFMGYVGLL